MQIDQVAKKLGRIVQREGYSWFLDKTHPHPRLVIRCSDPPAERFVLLSSSTNYDFGDRFRLKKHDLKRELRLMPKPNIPAKLSQESTPMNGTITAPGLVQVPTETVAPEDLVSYPLKLYIVGNKGGQGGAFAINMPKAIVEKIGKDHVGKIALDAEKHLVVFFGYTGTEAGRTRSEDTIRYVFPREKLDFEFTSKLEGSGPVVYARIHGETLISKEPVPSEILTGMRVKKANEYSLADGSAIKEMFNKWMLWARKEGFDPQAYVEKGELKISVAEKRMKEL